VHFHLLRPGIFCRRRAPRNINAWAFVFATAIEWEGNVEFAEQLVSYPNLVSASNKAREARHHVLFDVAVEEKIAGKRGQASVCRRVALQFLELTWERHGWRRNRIDSESFNRTQAVDVSGASGGRRQPPRC